jgi:hypothetical protein
MSPDAVVVIGFRRYGALCVLVAVGLLCAGNPARSEEIVNLSLRDFNQETDRELEEVTGDIGRRDSAAKESRAYVKRAYDGMTASKGGEGYRQARAQWLAALGTHIKNRRDLWEAKLMATRQRYEQHQRYMDQLRERLSDLDQDTASALADEADRENARIRREMQVFAEQLLEETATDAALLKNAGLSAKAMGSLQGVQGLVAKIGDEPGLDLARERMASGSVDKRSPIRTVLGAAESQQRDLFVRYNVLKAAINANKQVAANVLLLITEEDMEDGLSNARRFGVEDIDGDV